MKLDNKLLKLNFEGSQSIESFYSQAGQDIFVLSCINGKQNGTFLDLGCNHPTLINNTFLLENKFNWSGISYDIDCSKVNLFHNSRKTKAYCEDCTKLDFNNVIQEINTNHIDYLSLDLEPASVTLECLSKIPFNKISFSLITFEHDLYRFGEYHKNESRKIFEANGYIRICSDVKNLTPYEDWYYNPKYISYEYIKVLESDNKEWQDVLFYKE